MGARWQEFIPGQLGPGQPQMRVVQVDHHLSAPFALSDVEHVLAGHRITHADKSAGRLAPRQRRVSDEKMSGDGNVMQRGVKGSAIALGHELRLAQSQFESEIFHRQAERLGPGRNAERVLRFGAGFSDCALPPPKSRAIISATMAAAGPSQSAFAPKSGSMISLCLAASAGSTDCK
jgi:hypothetical protein